MFFYVEFFLKKSNTFTQGFFSLPLFALKKVMLEKVAAAGHLSRRWFFFLFLQFCSHFCAKWIQVAIVFAKEQMGKL